MQYFRYGEKEITHLSARDPVLGEVIQRIGNEKLEERLQAAIDAELEQSVLA